MTKKICCKCKILKNLNEFCKDKNRKDGYYITCKSCRNLNYHNKKDIIKEKNRKYYHNNKEKNHEKILIRNRKWRKNNPTYTTDRKKKDPIFKITKNLRRRLKRYLTFNYITKRSKTSELIGCPPEVLRTHIENKFTEGMSWDKIGNQIHIDHIIPLSSAKTEEDLKKLCHYSNLQPLWAKDNLKKSNKII